MLIQNDNKRKVILLAWFEEVISVAGKIFLGFYFVVTWPGPRLGRPGLSPLRGRNWLPCPDQSRCQGARDRDTLTDTVHHYHNTANSTSTVCCYHWGMEWQMIIHYQWKRWTIPISLQESFILNFTLLIIAWTSMFRITCRHFSTGFTRYCSFDIDIYTDFSQIFKLLNWLWHGIKIFFEFSTNYISIKLVYQCKVTERWVHTCACHITALQWSF